MKSSILDIKTFSDQDLTDELNRRLQAKPHYDFSQTELFDTDKTITPYEIMCKMIEKGWKEDPRKGYSNPQIDKMWDYVGFPKLTDDDSYCACTVNACLKLAGFEMSERIPASRSFESYGKNILLSEAKEGDIVVFKRMNSSWQGHVGFIKEILENSILVAGGNQDNMMCAKSYPFNDGYVAMTAIKRVSNMNKIHDIDWMTLKDWKLI